MKNNLPFLSERFVKKPLLVAALLAGGCFTEVMGQSSQPVYEYKAVKSGTWSNPNTWEKREVGTTTWQSLGVNERPSYLSGPISIPANRTVTLTESITADELSVAAGGTLTINYPVALTINDGSAETDLYVLGTVVAKGRGGDGFGNILKTVSSAAIEFGANSIYRHEYQESTTNPGETAWGMLPVATWDAASTVEINVAGATMTSTTVPTSANFNQSFGNVKWYTPAITADISLMAQLSEIKGNFEVSSTGTTGRLIMNNSLSHNYTLNVGQDLKILNSSKVIFAASNPNDLPGTFNLNIGKGLDIASTASFTHNRPSYPLKVTFTGTAGTISSPNVLRYMDFAIAQNANVTLLSNFAVAGNAGSGYPANSFNVYGTLNTGANTLSGGGSFTLENGGSLGIGAPTGLNGNLTVTTKTYQPEANFIYNSAYAQATGAGLPATVGGLIIDNVNNVEMTNNVTITNKLSLVNGALFTKNSNNVTRTLKLIESPALVVTASNNSYVDGAVNYEVATAGSKSMLFPIGKNSIARPITLTLTQGAGTNTYTATQTESPLSIATANLPTDINSVSDKRYYTISNTAAATVSDAFVKLVYNADEVVNNTEMRIIKSNGSGWVNLGGTLTANSTITSENAFSTFSQFAIAYKTITPLPVELTSLQAVKAENAVNVTWATASEKNNAYFSVERSADGKNFTAIGQVEGAGTTSVAKQYAFADKNPLSNVSYYRLKQVDLDGTSVYSQIVKVVNTKGLAASLNAFPNPTTATVNFEIGGLNEAASLQVMDLTGRVVAEQAIAKDAANAQVNLTSQPAGVYQVKLVTANGISVLKVVKN